MAEEHPLVPLIQANGRTAVAYLRRVNTAHQRLGYGSIPIDKKRVYRWLAGTVPEWPAQRAIAVLHGIPAHVLQEHPWPAWLTYADHDDSLLLASSWSPEHTDTLLASIAGGPMDRRQFTTVSALGLGAITTQWAAALPAAGGPGTRIGNSAVGHFDARLDALRHLDDQIGSGKVYAAARIELQMITDSLTGSSCTGTVRRRMYAAAAEAARICGWTAYDSGHHADAERHYITALNAAASAGDKVVAANTLAFWAIQRYSTGDPRGGVHLVEAALAAAPAIGSARMTAMLHARLARAHAKAGDRRASDHAAGYAFEAYDRAKAGDEEPACVYWVNRGELHQLAGSCALDVNVPRRALGHFTAAPQAHPQEAYDGGAYPRGAVIYLAREAEARIALGDIDGAVDTARRAIDHMGGVTSARSDSTLSSLRTQLRAHATARPVKDFLATMHC